MFQYWFVGLVHLFPNYETNTYGMSEYTMNIWHLLRVSNSKKFERGMILSLYHTTFKSTEVI